MIKVHVDPWGLYSRAMVRVARALERSMPPSFSITQRRDDADVIVLHTIGADIVPYADQLRSFGKRYVPIQYCLQTAGGTSEQWDLFWRGADFVWSYYDLSDLACRIGFRFYHAPLGLDDAFRYFNFRAGQSRENLIITSGYVSGLGAEPIQEVWEAAGRIGMKAIHLGPRQVQGMTKYPRNWFSYHDISDSDLAELYGRARYVSAMRYIEGFEMPGIEGLACGARPVVFDQPAMRHWYYYHGRYAPDTISGEALVEALVQRFQMWNADPEVTDPERSIVLDKFDWGRIASGFWQRLHDTYK